MACCSISAGISCLCCYVMAAVNSLLFCIGLVLILIGLDLKYKKNNNYHIFLKDAVQKANNETISFLPDILLEKIQSEFGFEFSNYDIDVLVGSFYILCLTLGILLMTFALLGTILSCLSKIVSKLLKLLFTIFMVCLAIATLVLMIIIRTLVCHDMTKSLEDYTGLMDNSMKGMTMNSIMIALDCCGIHSYEDFHELENWPPKYLNGEVTLTNTSDKIDMASSVLNLFDDDTSISFEGCSVVSNTHVKVTCPWMDSRLFLTPMSCCKNISDISKGCHLQGLANDSNNWMNVGCRTRIDDALSNTDFLRYIVPFIISVVVIYSLVLVLNFVFGGERKTSSIPDKKSSDISEYSTFEPAARSEPDQQEASIITLSTAV